jgi:hypothetical protein
MATMTTDRPDPNPINVFNAPDVGAIPGYGPDDLAAFVEARRANGLRVDRGWGLMYQSTADSILLDNRPDYGKRFYDGLGAFQARLAERGVESDNAVQLTITSFQHLPMYVLYGWETGIYNEFRHLQSRGLTRAMLLELITFAQLQAGMRGLQLVYNAVGRFLVDWRDGSGDVPLPAGWAADPDAFKAGLDLTVRDLTGADRAAIVGWYERTIGELPRSVEFALRYHPEMYKWHRARWEVIFKTLPKQVAPYVMIRQHMLTGNQEALREAVLLGKAWGITREWLVHGFAVSAYYTGFEGLATVSAAVGDLLDDMP